MWKAPSKICIRANPTYNVAMKLSVRLIPNAKKSEIAGWEGQTLKIRVSAPPIEGKANDELVKFLAEILDCAPSEIQILKGATSKNKLLDVPRLPGSDF